MSNDYTPTTAEVRGDYAHFQVPGGTDPVTGEFAEGLAEFDRWLAEYTRVKQAEALEEAADAWHAEHSGTRPVLYNWLCARAVEYRKGESDE